MYTIFQTGLPLKPAQNTFDLQYWGDGVIGAGNAFSFITGNGAFLSTVWMQAPGQFGDFITWNVSITPGDYVFTVFGQSRDDHAIVDFDIDGDAAFLSADWYDGGFLPNQSFVGGVTITSDNVVLRATVTGQNVASSGFEMNGQYFTFTGV